MAEGPERLRHPDCRWCDESERLNVGIMAENRALKGCLQSLSLKSIGEVLEKVERELDSAASAQDVEALLARVDAVHALLAPFMEKAK